MFFLGKEVEKVMSTQIDSKRLRVKDLARDLATTYIEPAFQETFIQKFPDTIPNTPNSFKTFIDALFSKNYNDMKTQFLVPGVNLNLTQLPIKVRDFGNTNNAYVQVNPNDLLSPIDGYKKSIKEVLPSATSFMEINLSSFVVPNSALDNHLKTIRRLYGLLEEQNYQRYKLMNRGKLTVNSKNKVVLYNGTVETFGVDDDDILQNYYNAFDEIRGSPIQSKTWAQTSVPTSDVGLDLIVMPYQAGGTYSLPSLIPPSGIIGDDMYVLSPQGATTNGKTKSFRTVKLNSTSIGTPGKVEYHTVTFYVRPREGSTVVNNATVRDKETVNISVQLIMEDKNPGQLNLEYSQENTYTLKRGMWTQVTMTRSIEVPSSVDFTNVDLLCKLNILHGNVPDAMSHSVVITGFQYNKSDVMNAPAASFNTPEFTDATNRIVVRRFLFLYEMLTTYFISAYLVENNFDLNTTGGRIARSIMSLVVEYIKNSSDNLIQTLRLGNVDETILNYMNNRLRERQVEYKTKYDRVQSTASSINDKKDVLRNSINSLNGQEQTNKTNWSFMVAAGSLAAFVIVGCAVAYSMPIAYNTKVVAVGATILIGIVLLMTFKLVVGNKIETFQTSITPTAIDELHFGIPVTALNTALMILSDTNVVILMLQTYNTYGAVNFALSKEDTYFTTVNSQIDNSSKKINDVKDAYTLDDYTYRARISFFINVAIIVALTAGGSILTENMPFVKNVILIAGAVAVLFALTVYLLDTSRRVRTKGRNIYWIPPPATML